MKICVLTGYYDPEITAETHLLLDLTSDLVKYGAEVVVITTFPSREIDEETRKKYLKIPEEVTTNSVKILRVGPKAAETHNFISRTIHYFLASMAIYLKAKKIKSDIFLITSTPPFLGVAGAWLSSYAPTVYNLQDMFPASLIYTNKLKKNSFPITILNKIEKYLLRKNTHILTISEDFKKDLLFKNVPENKITVINNWIDINAVIPVKRSENALVERYSLNPDDFFVTYCGNIGFSQNLEMIIDVAKKMEAECPDMKFLIIGNGSWRKNLEDYLAVSGAKNCLMLPYQPYSAISSVFSLGDVSVVCSRKGVSVGSVPSKTWGIMSAARAVLCSFDEESELCSIIRLANCGICVSPEDNLKFENALMSFYNDRILTEKYGKNGREFITRHFQREYCTFEYFKTIKKVYEQVVLEESSM